MSDQLDPLPPDLRALLAAEKRTRDDIPAEATHKALAAVRAAALPGATNVSASSGPVVWTRAKAILFAYATGVAGVVLGVAIERYVFEPVPPVAAPDVVATPAVPAVFDVVSAPDAGEASPAAKVFDPERLGVTKSPKPPREPVAAPPSSPEPVPVAPTSIEASSETQLIDSAREALAHGAPHDAMLFLMNHERRFPNGTLAEEREFLAISALRAEGRTDRARERASRFVSQFPQSAYVSRIRDLFGQP